MRRFLFPTATLFSIFGASSATWAQQEGGPGYGPYMMWNGGMGMFFGPLMMIVFVALIILMVRWLWGPGHGTPPHYPPGKTPLDILKERFARGEVDKEEFEERRRTLGE
jgi:putative membrane protein